MAAKVIYFVLNGRQEQVEFCSNDEPEDVHGKRTALVFNIMMSRYLCVVVKLFVNVYECFCLSVYALCI